jgi:hypothetical protein
MPGTMVLVKAGSLIKLVAKGTVELPDLAASDPTTGGATLRVFDSTGPGAGDDTYPLPAAGWSLRGNPPGASGMSYRGAGSGADPCRGVLVTPAGVKAVCKGTAVGLAPPFAGDVGIILDIGTGARRYCAVFGGSTVRNEDGLLVRRTAAAPTVCPTPAAVPSCSPLSLCGSCGNGTCMRRCPSGVCTGEPVCVSYSGSADCVAGDGSCGAGGICAGAEFFRPSCSAPCR